MNNNEDHLDVKKIHFILTSKVIQFLYKLLSGIYDQSFEGMLT